MGARGMGNRVIGEWGREGGRAGGLMEVVMEKGDLHFIQLLDYTSKSPVRPDPIISH